MGGWFPLSLAIWDFRSLEYLALANGMGIESFSLCTRDRHMAALWCGLKFNPVKTADAVTSTIGVSLELAHKFQNPLGIRE
jgi:hypothetical protein